MEATIRTIEEISTAEDEMFDRVWYERHQMRVIRAAERNLCPDCAGLGVGEKAARELERLYGLEYLGPYDDFEWGMLNGKLSALRWVLGDEWDMLDT
jgi:hypothetical protein